MRKKWLIGIAAGAAVILTGLGVAGYVLSKRFEPFVREQTVAYLSDRLSSEVQLEKLHVSMPLDSPLELLLRRGRGAWVRVSGDGLALRFRGHEDLPPMVKMAKFQFEVEAATLWAQPVRVRRVILTGLQIQIPPKGRRPKGGPSLGKKAPPVNIEIIRADGSSLTILPAQAGKEPLRFDIHKLLLRGTGLGQPMRYEAFLTNAKPPGMIEAKGHFGPWAAEEPGDSPLDGEYKFTRADLGVFKGIAGTLHSTGKFAGQLDELIVDGEADVPDFRLKSVNNVVPLKTQFHAIVDGTNGDTRLEPVRAQLGQTSFVAHGGVVRYEGQRGKTVDLSVRLLKGQVEDLLRLAMKGPKTILRGGIGLTMRMTLPPGQGEIADRLRVAGRFQLEGARFTSPTVQDKIDELSRRGLGRPKDERIDEVASDLGGQFRLAGGVIDFESLRFTAPGALVSLKGRYSFDKEELDFRGHLRLQAKVSQTQSGWKRWALKPVDPFFAKEGAGTLLAIRVDGTRSEPKFGRDRGEKQR